MYAAVVLLVALSSAPHVFAQTDARPPVVAKMEALGTVFLTYAEPPADKTAPKGQPKPGAIIGVDFRPTSGTDPKKIAAAVKEMGTLPDLQTVLLLGRDVTDEAADALPKSVKLVSIQFFNTQVSDVGIAKLSRFPNLHTFKYTGMNISDQGMHQLAKIKSLQTIEITDSKITDQGVLALQVLPNLVTLSVENTAATQQSIDQLRERLPRIESRRSLR